MLKICLIKTDEDRYSLGLIDANLFELLDQEGAEIVVLGDAKPKLQQTLNLGYFDNTNREILVNFFKENL